MEPVTSGNKKINRINPTKTQQERKIVDLEFLLLNSLKITAEKVQEVTNKYLLNRKYKSIFCLQKQKQEMISSQKA